jgi:predicted DNA-binding protein
MQSGPWCDQAWSKILRQTYATCHGLQDSSLRIISVRWCRYNGGPDGTKYLYYNVLLTNDMTISLRVTDEEYSVIKTYAELKGETLSNVIRKAVMRMIEDEYDIQAYLKAKAEFEKDPVTYSLNDIKKELGLF